MDYTSMENVPLGFGMALAQNTAALERFAALSEQEKKALIEGAHDIGSRREMREYVSGIGGIRG